jgi:hypothetical protein
MNPRSKKLTAKQKVKFKSFLSEFTSNGKYKIESSLYDNFSFNKKCIYNAYMQSRNRVRLGGKFINTNLENTLKELAVDNDYNDVQKYVDERKENILNFIIKEQIVISVNNNQIFDKLEKARNENFKPSINNEKVKFSETVKKVQELQSFLMTNFSYGNFVLKLKYEPYKGNLNFKFPGTDELEPLLKMKNPKSEISKYLEDNYDITVYLEKKEDNKKKKK